MYDIGDYVVYGHNGICRVEDITNPGFSGVDKDKKYYVLQPLNTKGSKIYSPMNNKKVLIRSVMTSDEAEKFIEEIPMVEVLWIGNEKMREESYKATKNLMLGQGGQKRYRLWVDIFWEICYIEKNKRE